MSEERIALLRGALAKKGNAVVVWDDEALQAFRADEVLTLVNSSYDAAAVQGAYERGLQEGSAAANHELPLFVDPNQLVILARSPMAEQIEAGARRILAYVEAKEDTNDLLEEPTPEEHAYELARIIYIAMRDAYPFDHPLMIRYGTRKRT